MPKRVPQVVVSVLFIGLLLVPLALKKFGAGVVGDNASGATNAKVAMSRYGFHLEEVARASGVDFVHQAPKLDPKLDPIMPQVASMGAAVAVCDYDRDGWQDFYVTQSGEKSRNRLYRNLHNGKFEDVAAKLGVADLNASDGVSMGAIWGDCDNDGWEDLLVYKWGRPRLLRNNAGKSFTDITDKANLPSWINANSGVWFDYDRDGKLDLFIGGYYSPDVDLWHLKTTRIMPDSLEYAKNGSRKYLLHNLGKGRFEDVTSRMGLDTRHWALAAVAADLRGTGYPDLFVANDYGVAELFANQNGRGFKEIGAQSGVGEAPKSGMNASVGDVLNQGKFAIYATNISEEGVLLQGNNLWMPSGGKDNDVRYQNMARDMGVELGGWSFGAQFGDLNNDGHLDLYLTNGYISGDKAKNYWYDYSKVSGGNSSIIGDASNWPAMNGRSLSGYQPKRVWISDGAGHFSDVAQAVGVEDRHDGRAVALADLWNRGVLDVVVANQRGPLLIYKNTVSPQNKWIEFELQGLKSNGGAIGAQVRLFWNGAQQVQEVSGGSGFCAQNGRRLHFGLGQTSKIDKAVIRWPSGAMQTISAPQIGKIHRLKEPSAP